MLEKLNTCPADIVINTGDSTTDGMEEEFKAAKRFLKDIECQHVISIIGNHEKRNARSHELFQKYIYKTKVIYPLRPEFCGKKHLFLNRTITKIEENFTDVNFIKTVSINEKTLLIIGVDSNELYDDCGYIEEEVLDAISERIYHINHDECLLLSHSSILGTDEDPFKNPLRLIDFINKHKIEHVFCGHTHELELRRSTDLYRQHTFTQYMCGSISSCNHAHDTNQFLFYENWGDEDMQIHLVRIIPQGRQLIFKEEIILRDSGVKE